MHISLGYGNGVIEADIDEARVDAVLRPNDITYPDSEAELIRNALKNPIGTGTIKETFGPGESVCIVTSDITRPCPSYKMLPPLLEELDQAGVRNEDILIVFALGAHRKHTPEEIEHLVGTDIANQYRCVDMESDDVVLVGTSSNGTPFEVFRPVAEASRRICLGNIEYHYFAGYSGGIKAIVPGVCSHRTIQANHTFMVDERAATGNLKDNPVRDDMEEMLGFLSVDMILNVVLAPDKTILHASAGDCIKAHRAGCAYLDGLYRFPLKRGADIVIVTPRRLSQGPEHLPGPEGPGQRHLRGAPRRGHHLDGGLPGGIRLGRLRAVARRGEQPGRSHKTDSDQVPVGRTQGCGHRHDRKKGRRVHDLGAGRCNHGEHVRHPLPGYQDGTEKGRGKAWPGCADRGHALRRLHAPGRGCRLTKANQNVIISDIFKRIKTINDNEELIMALFTKEEALEYHSIGRKGKVEVVPVKPCVTQKHLSMAYSPGVAEACMAIHADPEKVYEYTGKGNLVGVVSNGTAVLGLGNIGPEAGKPVMEGKGVLFKVFGDVDVYDIDLNVTDPDKLCEVVKALEPTFGGINLEDIKAPECFYIEEKLKKEMNIPVFHDDQHGTAIVTAAGMMNAIEISGKDAADMRVVISGAGAAAIACTNLYRNMGVKFENIAMFDSKGHINKSRTDLNEFKQQYATEKTYASLAEAMVGADCFLGLSKAGVVSKEMVKSMSDNCPIIFACANPDPEISYTDAKEARPDCIMGTGRSDFPNQVNNVLGFPFIFRARSTAAPRPLPRR